jgi:hypothetical protein
MNRNKITIIGLALVLATFVIYSDQSFEAENIEALRESARSSVEILPENEFTTDGCSLWFNSIFDNDFTEICIEHDIEYWKGGNNEDRKIADDKLREQINEMMPFMGDFMYLGVRLFGHPLLSIPWRQGYGFEYPLNLDIFTK